MLLANIIIIIIFIYLFIIVVIIAMNIIAIISIIIFEVYSVYFSPTLPRLWFGLLVGSLCARHYPSPCLLWDLAEGKLC